MDVRMPKLDGIAACEKICAAPTRPRADARRSTSRTCTPPCAGASGFLLKDAPADQLVEAIQVVARGDAQLAPQITRLLIEEVAKRPAVDHHAHPWLDALTEREGEVLRLMSGRSNAEIAADLYLGEATVKTHVGRVLAKLGARDRAGGGDGLRVRSRRAGLT